MTRAHRILLAALLALAGLYLVWFGRQGDTAAVVIFALPPLLFAAGTWRRRPHAPFWAAVLALLWFSHGIMVAWTRPPESVTVAARRVPTFESSHSPCTFSMVRKCRCRKRLSSIARSPSRPTVKTASGPTVKASPANSTVNSSVRAVTERTP